MPDLSHTRRIHVAVTTGKVVRDDFLDTVSVQNKGVWFFPANAQDGFNWEVGQNWN